jgi:peroxiredoxin Q/BCP
VIFGVSFDDQKDNAAFSKKFGFNFPLLCDTDRRIGIAYGAADPGSTSGNARRIAYVIDPQGRIREAHEKVDARSYPQEQLKTIQAA